jgi:hypothetical protein
MVRKADSGLGQSEGLGPDNPLKAVKDGFRRNGLSFSQQVKVAAPAYPGTDAGKSQRVNLPFVFELRRILGSSAFLQA